MQGYVKQQRTIKRSKLYTKSSAGRSSSSSKSVQIVSKELVGGICQPTGRLAGVEGAVNRAAFCAEEERSKVNIVNIGSAHHYVTPPDCLNVQDNSFPIISSNYDAPNKSYPHTALQRNPYWIYDCGAEDGRTANDSDAVLYQPGTLYILASPQSGQMWRLANYAQDYDKYRILAIKVHWVPTCTTAVPGVLVMYVETNPTVCPTIEKEKMMMNKNSLTTSIYVPQTMTYVNPDKGWKWCVSPTSEAIHTHGNRLPDRLSDSFGIYIRYFGCEPAENADDMASLGYIYIEYIAEFTSQTNNTTQVADPMHTAPFIGDMTNAV